MEYEIDSEEALFDSSTNPSLQPDPEDQHKPGAKRQPAAKDKRELQKGEVIPEEEEQPS